MSPTQVSQLMTRPVVSCRQSDPLEQAARLMWERDCGCLPVVADGEGARLVGMITDRDICMSAFLQGRNLKELPVVAAMAPAVRVCRPEDTIREAENVMATAGVRRLPVVDPDGQLVGLLSMADIARHAARVPEAQGEFSTLGVTLARVTRPRRPAEIVGSDRPASAAG
jgi:CBS domain-containing protein